MSATTDDSTAPDPASAKAAERRALGVACGAHALHDGYTDLVYVMLPIWQGEFGLGFAALGLMRTVFSGTLAGFQIPAGFVAERFGATTVLALGTALEISVNDTCRLRRPGTLGDSPCTRFLRTDREIGHKVQKRVAGAHETVEPSFL